MERELIKEGEYPLSYFMGKAYRDLTAVGLNPRDAGFILGLEHIAMHRGENEYRAEMQQAVTIKIEYDAQHRKPHVQAFMPGEIRFGETIKKHLREIIDVFGPKDLFSDVFHIPTKWNFPQEERTLEAVTRIIKQVLPFYQPSSSTGIPLSTDDRPVFDSIRKHFRTPKERNNVHVAYVPKGDQGFQIAAIQIDPKIPVLQIKAEEIANELGIPHTAGSLLYILGGDLQKFAGIGKGNGRA